MISASAYMRQAIVERLKSDGVALGSHCGQHGCSRKERHLRHAAGQGVKRVMLDPDWARQLPAKAPAKPGTGFSLSIAAQLRRLSAFFPLVASQPAPTKH
jgi:hypothetical protein